MTTTTHPEERTRRLQLNKDTWIPLGLAVSIVLAVSGGAVWLNTKLAAIDYRLEDIQQDVQRLEQRTDDRELSLWTFREMRHWTELFQSLNPEITVPTPKR